MNKAITVERRLILHWFIWHLLAVDVKDPAVEGVIKFGRDFGVSLHESVCNYHIIRLMLAVSAQLNELETIKKELNKISEFATAMCTQPPPSRRFRCTAKQRERTADRKPNRQCEH